MGPVDRHYLSLQFKLHVHSKDGAEFQSFFEGIMEKAFPDYRKVRPYGSEGDSGNDGYRPDLGIYYQVYAPTNPKLREADAAKKWRKDFEKLRQKWDKISTIRQHNFVFNDKYRGAVRPLEEAASALKTEYPEIDFKLILAKDLESVFFGLKEDAKLGLGFSIDKRQALDSAGLYMRNVEKALDRGDASAAKSMLEGMGDPVSSLSDEDLSLDLELLECQCLQKLENVDEAQERFEDISKRSFRDPRALLYLAEIYFNRRDFAKNSELLERARAIDPDNWLLRLGALRREITLGEKIGNKQIDEKTFPSDPRVRATFYRLYAVALAIAGRDAEAGSFSAQAIHLDPERFANHLDGLSVIELMLFATQEDTRRLELSQGLLNKAQEVESKFTELGNIGARNQAALNAKKLTAFFVQENVAEIEALSKATFDLALTCYFDVHIEQVILGVMHLVTLPDSSLNQFLEYLKASKMEISDDLCKVLVPQFGIREALFTGGKKFFKEIHKVEYVNLVADLEARNYAKILPTLRQDVPFALTLASTLRGAPDLRNRIIENLPDEKEIQKEKLRLLLNFEQEEYDKAFEILKQLDLSGLEYVECRPMLEIAHRTQAWDFEIILLEKLLEKEPDDKKVFALKLQQIDALRNLKKYREVMHLGEQLLKEDSEKHLLDSRNRETLLASTVQACLERGKVDDVAARTAKRFLEEYRLAKPTFEFKVGIEAEANLANHEGENALQAVIDAVRLKKVLSAQEYAGLYYLFLRIGNQTDLNQDPLPDVQPSTFVKLAGRDQWYFVGTGNELDASPIREGTEKYRLFIGKKPGDIAVFQGRYTSERVEYLIETIYSIEKYVLWRTLQNFQELAMTGDLEGVQRIEVRHYGDAIDLQNVQKFFEEMSARTTPLFDIYCGNRVPLAVLAASEGGLTNAFARIQSEGRGFINFSVGTLDEFEAQKRISREVLHNQAAFYIDGTAAFTLSETGLLPKIRDYFPNLKVPQSVIDLLARTVDRLGFAAGESGYLGYAKGKVIFSSLEKERREALQSRFLGSIKALEENPKYVGAVASASKMDCFSEKQIGAELSDACILAQREQCAVLTEDFLYLQVNEAETKKKAPPYFSSLALVRVLYEEGKVNFAVYLDYFSYLASYRFRFLSIHAEDLEKAVFGDGSIKIPIPKNLRKLNFPLTLAEDYGVAFQEAFRLIGGFLLRILIDGTVTLDLAQEIFIEIIETFPSKVAKQDLGRMLLGVCLQVIEKHKVKLFFIPADELVRQKFDRLWEVTKLYNAESRLWTAN